MEAGEFGTNQEPADYVGPAERHFSRQPWLADLAPEVRKRPTCGREASVVSLYDLCLLAGGRVGNRWGGQLENELQVEVIGP